MRQRVVFDPVTGDAADRLDPHSLNSASDKSLVAEVWALPNFPPLCAMACDLCAYAYIVDAVSRRVGLRTGR
jgi:hypothetical protein